MKRRILEQGNAALGARHAAQIVVSTAHVASAWRTVQGCRIHALEAGAATSVVVLVHGLGVSSRYFLPLARALAPHFHVLAPDLPGTGESERPQRVRDLAELADALCAWLDAVGLERVVFVGNSMGCQVLAELASKRPERVEKLVFIGPTVDPRWRSVRRQVPRWLLEATREPFSLLPILVRDYFAFGPRRFFATARFALRDRLELRLPRIAAPTLVVRGEHDAFVSTAWMREVTRLLPNGSSTVVRDAAHAAHYSAPAMVADVVRSFLEEKIMALELHSPAFGDGDEIPRDYTADGKNEPPPLQITGVPREAKSLALVVDDPDAPRATPFTHWVVWDIPTNVEQIGCSLPTVASEGTNDFGRQGYGGPKPPFGRHRYVFKLYALDTELSEQRPLTKEELERRIEGHVLAETELVGTYARAA